MMSRTLPDPLAFCRCNADFFAPRTAFLPATGSSSSDSLSVRSGILKSEDVSLSYRPSPCPEPLSSSPPSDKGEAEVTAGKVGVTVSPTSEVTALPLSLSK